MQFCKDLVYKLSEEKMKVKRFIGGSLEENSYVVYRKTGGECYIIDPGHSADKILKFIKEEKLSPKGILLTHHHYDHTDAVDKIRESRELPVFLHREDLDAAGLVAYCHGEYIPLRRRSVGGFGFSVMKKSTRRRKSKR